MRRETDEAEERKFDALLNSIAPGNVYFVTGKNGSGKSRFFACDKGIAPNPRH